MNRILVVVDVSNLYYSIKKRFGDNRKLCYRKLLKYAQERGSIYRAICYSSDMKGKANDFFACIKNLGYELKLKPVKQYTNRGQLYEKSNLDIDMVVDIVRFTSHFDELVFVTSDGDMVPIVKYVQERGVKVHVLSCAINNDLREVVDSWNEVGPSLLERIHDEEVDVVAKSAE